ncbi:MAG: UDP-N-acetylmuramate dehydrogenase [Verrucomicrobia bacterium]|nr:UDP-N-acetylmuramate dehydrogenase [Cytophagales bacterium]
MIAFQKNASLKRYNTFGIEAQADFLTKISTEQQLLETLADDYFSKMPKMVLGGGSNVLFTKDFAGLVMLMQIGGIEILEETQESVVIKVGAGVNWHDLVIFTINKNWGGFENLSLIPGTVGAAPMQNIGAYGVEIKDTIINVEALALSDNQKYIFSNAACKFAYRESIFKNEVKNQFIITAVIFRLTKNPTHFNMGYGDIQQTLQSMNVAKPSLQTISEAVIQIRRSKLPDPQQFGNAGSFFKNPEILLAAYQHLKHIYDNIPSYLVSDTKVKVPAAWLIEQSGWKGKTFGNYGVHDKQPLVLINFGQAKGEEIWNLALQIQQSVYQKFGIMLSPEVNKI